MSNPEDPFVTYVRTKAPGAFEQVVKRHVDAVYSQCVRELRNTALAEEVTQTVFVTLAQKAPRIGHNVVIGGWLFKATRYFCANARRSEMRRIQREQRAARMR